MFRHVSQQLRLSLLLLTSVMVALLLFLTVPAGHAAAHTHSPADDTLGLEQVMFAMINTNRLSAQLSPYAWDENLAIGARAHSALMAGTCGAQHQCPGEPDPGTRISNDGVSYTSWGENIGYWGGEASHADDLWQINNSMLSEGPGGGHYDNLMSNAFQRVGIGIVIDANNQVWVTEDFVQP